MSHDDDRASAMLASRDERISGYLRTTRSTDDIVRDVTKAFASDVARIMADAGTRSRAARAGDAAAPAPKPRARRR